MKCTSCGGVVGYPPREVTFRDEDPVIGYIARYPKTVCRACYDMLLKRATQFEREEAEEGKR